MFLENMCCRYGLVLLGFWAGSCRSDDGLKALRLWVFKALSRTLDKLGTTAPFRERTGKNRSPFSLLIQLNRHKFLSL
jgi:hypothetical protein